MSLLRKIRIKTPEEIEKMRNAGRVVALILNAIQNIIKPNISTKALERCAVDIATSFGVKTAFFGYRGFPGHICVSINEEVVHGIPSEKRLLKEGEIVSVDVGIEADGFFADAAATFPVGTISTKAQKLISVTKKSLDIAIQYMRPGLRLSQLSSAIENFVHSNRFSVVREYVGHGIGAALHEDPAVPNYCDSALLRNDVVFVPGIVLAIEPMVNEGTSATKKLQDGWTVVTLDGKLSAHFEHTVAVTESEPLIITAP
jgi:methionyl aminopeptidase